MSNSIIKQLIFCILMLFTIFSLASQDLSTITIMSDDDDEEDERIPLETDWSRSMFSYNRGDQTFCINLGFVIPLFYLERDNGFMNTQMNLGGMGSLAYNYFLSSNLYWGVEISGMFASTVGENMYYIVPMGGRIGYQLQLSRFEFPLSLMLGIAPQSHNQRSYFSWLFVKPGIGIFFRVNNDWSFGINSSFWWVPQLDAKTGEFQDRRINIHGFFIEITAGARYHF